MYCFEVWLKIILSKYHKIFENTKYIYKFKKQF